MWENLHYRQKYGLKEYWVILTCFYHMDSEDINKKAYFQNFSWFQFYVSKLWMVMCVSLLSQTAVLNKVSCARLSVKIALISYWSDISLITLGKCASLIEESYENMQKNSKFCKFTERPVFDIRVYVVKWPGWQYFENLMQIEDL